MWVGPVASTLCLHPGLIGFVVCTWPCQGAGGTRCGVPANDDTGTRYGATANDDNGTQNRRGASDWTGLCRFAPEKKESRRKNNSCVSAESSPRAHAYRYSPRGFLPALFGSFSIRPTSIFIRRSRVGVSTYGPFRVSWIRFLSN